MARYYFDHPKPRIFLRTRRTQGTRPAPCFLERHTQILTMHHTIELTNRLCLTIDETAEVLSCSRRQIYRLLADEPKLPAVKFGSRTWVPVGALQEWVVARTIN